MSERKRMPDERPSITKKLTIHHASEDSQLEWLADRLKDKLRRIRTLATLPTVPEGTSNAFLNRLLKIVDEPEEIPTGKIEDVDVYIQVGFYPDTNKPGEIFLKTDRMGSSISGLLDALSMSISVALQTGVPLSWFVDKLKNLRFPPSGPTNDPRIRQARSIVDGVARWLEYRFPDEPGTTGAGDPGAGSGGPTPG